MPFCLVIFRILCAPFIVIFASIRINHCGLFCTIILALGVLSDIFDGVLARKFNVVTDNLRLWDSRADVIFWVCTAIALHILYPTLWHISWVMIIVLGIMETIPRIISHIRFKREASTHHILSKIFTLFLWATISLAFLNGELGNLYWLTLLIGIISQLEAIAIMLIIPKWAVDVKSIKSAWKMRTDFILGNKYP
ncbi:MAG: CDP-alcohol phosphatidyltransferase family protein [Proteobacteria bacterium]|nr:CDP-alcohol phosphatidyltransferase family protein [Pseudomonadota bacterium]